MASLLSQKTLPWHNQTLKQLSSPTFLMNCLWNPGNSARNAPTTCSLLMKGAYLAWLDAVNDCWVWIPSQPASAHNILEGKRKKKKTVRWVTKVGFPTRVLGPLYHYTSAISVPCSFKFCNRFWCICCIIPKDFPPKNWCPTELCSPAKILPAEEVWMGTVLQAQCSCVWNEQGLRFGTLKQCDKN